jgi:hypothetical protein
MDIALRSFETALRKHPRSDHRHRIEYSGNANCTIEHMRKMKELNITASLNPGFIYFLGEQEYVNKPKSEDDIFSAQISFEQWFDNNNEFRFWIDTSRSNESNLFCRNPEDKTGKRNRSRAGDFSGIGA